MKRCFIILKFVFFIDFFRFLRYLIYTCSYYTGDVVRTKTQDFPLF